MDPVPYILEKLGPTKRQVDGSYMGKCPAHEDRQASLHLSEGRDGKAILKCHAGCDIQMILGKLGLEMKDLFPPRGPGRSATGKSQIEAVYDYTDAAGKLLHQTVRYRPKKFSQRRPDGKGGFIWSLSGIETVIYRLPEVLKAAKVGAGVIVTEGEKDADNLVALGFTATCNAMGAGPGKWLERYSEYLRGAHVVIIADMDGPAKHYAGELFAEERAASLQGRAKSVKVIHLEGCKDVTDWIAAGGTAEQLRQMIKATPEWTVGWWAPPKVVQLQVGSPAPRPEPEWTPLVPIGIGELPDFPVELLPEALRDYVVQQAAAIQVPIASIAMIVLSVCAAAVARKLRIELASDYEEPLNLFTAIVMPPGERKSEALRTATAPLREWELEAIRRSVDDIEETAARKEILEARARAAKMKAAKAKDEEAATTAKDAVRLAREAAALRVPSTPKVYTSNATPEALTTLLEQHDGRMAVFSPEGGIFSIMAGHYSRGSPNFEVFLCGHTGDDIKVDRRGRSETILRPALTMALTIQPDVLESFSETKAFRGRGLLGRFLYAIPTSLLGWRSVDPPPVRGEVRERYRQLIRALLDLPQPLRDQPERMLQLSGDAQRLFLEFRAEVEMRLRPFGHLGAMTDWGGKLVGAIGRIIGLMHLVENSHLHTPWERKVETALVFRLTGLTDFFISHALAAFAGMQADPKWTDAQLVLKWLTSERRERFTLRDLHQALRGRSRFKFVEALNDPIALLSKHGYIRRANSEDSEDRRRGRKAPNFQLNPLLYSAEYSEGTPSTVSGEKESETSCTKAPSQITVIGPKHTQLAQSHESECQTGQWAASSGRTQYPQFVRDPGQEG